MSALQQLQSEFRQHLLHPDARMQAHIVGSERVNVMARLAIYADGYRMRLTGALEANYPALHQWLGDGEFHRLGRAYMDAYPSQHYSIRWFGHRLPQFVADSPPWREQAFVHELAVFEWAMSQAFDAADDSIVTLEHIAATPPDAWPDMCLRFHPSLHRLRLGWNVAPIWRALTRDECLEEPRETEARATWIVWRQEFSLYYRALDAHEAWALDAAVEGHNFTELCEGLCACIDPEHVAARAASYLRQWVTDGAITRIESGG